MDILSEFSILGTLVQMQRKFPYFKIHLTIIELPPNLQLEVNNVLCNDMLKRRGHGKNPIVYKCLPSEYAQLKSCSRIDTSIWQYVSVRKDIFKDEMCKISLQITIHRWSLTIDFNDRKH